MNRYGLQDIGCPVDGCPWRFLDPDNCAQHLDEEHEEASRWPLFGNGESIRGTDTGQGDALVYDVDEPQAWIQSDLVLPVGGGMR